MDRRGGVGGFLVFTYRVKARNNGVEFSREIQ